MTLGSEENTVGRLFLFRNIAEPTSTPMPAPNVNTRFIALLALRLFPCTHAPFLLSYIPIVRDLEHSKPSSSRCNYTGRPFDNGIASAALELVLWLSQTFWEDGMKWQAI